jgi:2-hydroxy-6-oxonona-2,4-dienedioate hydrolase
MSGFWAAIDRTPISVTWRRIDGVDTRVIEAGSSSLPPVVLLHGTGGHAESFIFNLARLSRDHRVVAYDLPGHGWSAGPERSYEIAGYSQHLSAVLDDRGIRSAVLVGQSLGGWVALDFAREHPERVERLVLVGPGGTTMNPAVMARIREDSLDAVRNPTEESVRRRVQLLMPDPPDELVQCRLRIYSQPDALLKTELLLCLQDPEVRARNLLTDEHLRAVPHPTLLVGGDRDVVVPLDAVERMAQQLPNAQLAVMRGCGHWPQFERPEEFNAHVETFLQAAVHP